MTWVNLLAVIGSLTLILALIHCGFWIAEKLEGFRRMKSRFDYLEDRLDDTRKSLFSQNDRLDATENKLFSLLNEVKKK